MSYYSGYRCCFLTVSSISNDQVLFQTTRETPTPKAIRVKPSVAVMTSDQGDHVQEAVMTLRSEVVSSRYKLLFIEGIKTCHYQISY